MKTLEMDQMEQIEGGSCSGAIAQAVFTGMVMTTVSGGFGIALAIVGAYANADNIATQCFS